ncbi:hypothetical protein BJV77DRAFT_1130006 [Russula vinacea]|nr:hypothetical protein BJV77DRAFT_1130006 [Russula vinacea]
MSGLSTFKQSFKGDVVTPGDDGYSEAISRWAANAERPARVVAFVKDIDDIALALKYARTNQLQVAIRGGGHSPSGALLPKTALLLISLAISITRSSIRRSAPRAWGEELCGGLSKMKLFSMDWPVMNGVTHGIESLLLGGGFGFLTGQHGLVIDSLLQATIVTANGTALHSVSPKMRTCSGAFAEEVQILVSAPNLSSDCTTAPHCLAGKIIFPAAILDDLMEVLCRWWTTVKDHEAMQQILGRDPAGNDCIILKLFYNGPEEEGRKNFQKFYDLKPIIDWAREIPFESLNALSNEMFVHGSNYYLKSVFQSGPRPEITKSVFKKDSTAFPYSSRSRGVTGAALKWNRNAPGVDDAAKRAARELTSIVARQKFRYRARTPTADTGISRLKAQYDPENVFSKWFPIIPNQDA